jgi:hypothetical protein
VSELAYLPASEALARFREREHEQALEAARAAELRVDYSIFVGLPVAAALYWLLCRDLDLENERRMVAEEGILEHKRERRT